MAEVATRDETDKVIYHWFLLSFMVPGLGYTGYRAQIVNNDNMNLTMPKLLSIREQCQIEQEAVMLAISYLGYMSTNEMKGKAPPEPVVIRENSQAYLDGFESGLLDDLDGIYSNPHQNGPDSDQAAVVDWLNGRIAGSNKQRERLLAKAITAELQGTDSQ